jgi:dephospho-CoA kinase
MHANLKIVGVVGPIGSGKDTIAKYISNKYSMRILSIGDIAREIAQNKGLPATRENLQKITEKYYVKFGRTYFIKETIRRIKHSNDKVVITGIRAPTDVTTLRKHFHENLILIRVTANKKERFQDCSEEMSLEIQKHGENSWNKIEKKKRFSSSQRHTNSQTTE